MNERNLAVVLLAVGVSAALYLSNTGGLGSGARASAFGFAIVSMLSGVALSLHTRRDGGRTTADGPGVHRAHDAVRALTLPGLAFAILAVPIYFASVAAGVVTTIVVTATVFFVVRRDQRAAKRRGVPSSERWRRRHSRTLFFEQPHERVLRSLQTVLREDLRADITVSDDGSVDARTSMGAWESGQQIHAQVVARDGESCVVSVSSQPVFGALDGGRSWAAVTEIERRLNEVLAPP